ncbi:MAG: non-canonical purine NTP pyrophosphatase, partial [Thermoleophilia bacterium]
MLPEKIILATGNANKACEFGQLLDDIRVEAMPAGFELPPETGATFEENARLKVEAVREQYLAKKITPEATVPWIMADDSGIEIKAFAGAPGIYSARYAGEDATDVDNVNKLLKELEGNDDRRAR